MDVRLFVQQLPQPIMYPRAEIQPNFISLDALKERCEALLKPVYVLVTGTLEEEYGFVAFESYPDASDVSADVVLEHSSEIIKKRSIAHAQNKINCLWLREVVEPLPHATCSVLGFHE